jgi:hypothetical protein
MNRQILLRTYSLEQQAYIPKGITSALKKNFQKIHYKSNISSKIFEAQLAQLAELAEMFELSQYSKSNFVANNQQILQSESQVSLDLDRRPRREEMMINGHDFSDDGNEDSMSGSDSAGNEDDETWKGIGNIWKKNVLDVLKKPIDNVIGKENRRGLVKKTVKRISKRIKT